MKNFLERSVKKLIWLPYFWLVIFCLFPIFILAGVALGGYHPQTGHYIFEFVAHKVLLIRLDFSFLQMLLDDVYVKSFFISVLVAGFSTFIALILGYPFAYAISRCKEPLRTVFVVLAVLPFWTSFLIRIYSWITLLGPSGVLSKTLLFLGIIDAPLSFVNNLWAVSMGIVYSYFPFMVLPLYAVLDKIDNDLVEAASDLGCRSWRTFWKIIIPLSKSGVIAGVFLVFVPAMGEVVIPDLLGNNNALMIGKVLWNDFFHNNNAALSAAVALLLIVLMVTPIVIIQNLEDFYERRESNNG